MSNNFRLNEADKQSQTWHKIEDHLKQMIESYRSELEKPNKSVSSLNDDVLRGLILAYRRLLAKADDIVITDEDAT